MYFSSLLWVQCACRKTPPTHSSDWLWFLISNLITILSHHVWLRHGAPSQRMTSLKKNKKLLINFSLCYIITKILDSIFLYQLWFQTKTEVLKFRSMNPWSIGHKIKTKPVLIERNQSGNIYIYINIEWTIHLIGLCFILSCESFWTN